MPLSGKPAATELQVGEDVYFIYDNKPQAAKVVSTSTEVTNPNSDSSGVTETIYYLEGYSKAFSYQEVYDSKASLILQLSYLIGILIEIIPQEE